MSVRVFFNLLLFHVCVCFKGVKSPFKIFLLSTWRIFPPVMVRSEHSRCLNCSASSKKFTASMYGTSNSLYQSSLFYAAKNRSSGIHSLQWRNSLYRGFTVLCLSTKDKEKNNYFCIKKSRTWMRCPSCSSLCRHKKNRAQIRKSMRKKRLLKVSHWQTLTSEELKKKAFIALFLPLSSFVSILWWQRGQEMLNAAALEARGRSNHLSLSPFTHHDNNSSFSISSFLSLHKYAAVEWCRRNKVQSIFKLTKNRLSKLPWLSKFFIVLVTF